MTFPFLHTSPVEFRKDVVKAIEPHVEIPFEEEFGIVSFSEANAFRFLRSSPLPILKRLRSIRDRKGLDALKMGNKRDKRTS